MLAILGTERSCRKSSMAIQWLFMHTIYRPKFPYIFNGLLKMQSTGRSSRKFSKAVHAYNLASGTPMNFQWLIENAIYRTELSYIFKLFMHTIERANALINFQWPIVFASNLRKRFTPTLSPNRKKPIDLWRCSLNGRKRK